MIKEIITKCEMVGEILEDGDMEPKSRHGMGDGLCHYGDFISIEMGINAYGCTSV